MSILERFKNRCPICNHNEVRKIISEVFCGYCEHKWYSIYDYEADCEPKEELWKLQDKVDELEDKISTIKNLMQENIQTKWIKSSDAYLEQLCVIDDVWFNRWIAKMNKALKDD